jgi:hypothetical protein
LIIAGRLGYAANTIDDLASLSEAERTSLEAETEEAIENWDDADVDGILPAASPSDPLQALLDKHHRLGEEILDIQDAAAGIGNGEDDDDDS